MSKIILQSSNTGNGNITINAPVTDTDRTFVLPDDSGSILTTSGGTMTGPLAGFSSTGIDDNATTTSLTIDSAGRVLLPSQPAFVAFGNSASTSVATGGVFILQQTQTNIGSCYNTSNGRFTAPVSGFYHFTYGAYAYSTVQVAFKLNGSDWTPTDSIGIFTVDANTAQNASLSLRLSSNDYVQIGMRASYSGNIYFNHTWFSGHFVG